MAKRDNQTAARALADWARHGFTETAARPITDKYKVTTRTLWRWKAALDDDTELSGLFRDRLNDALNKDWATHLDEALTELVQRIRTLANDDEATLNAVVDAFRALSEVHITREVLRGAADASPHRGYETPRRETTANGATTLN